MARENEISDIIYTVGGKNKFFDMRNALNLAYVEDYAQIHGLGGGKHAPNSGITLSITDYGDKSASKFVTANVSPYIIDKMLAVCQQNAGNRVGGETDLAAALSTMNAKLDRIFAGLLNGAARAVTACGNIVKQRGHEKGPIADFGQVMKAARDGLADKEADIKQFGVRNGYTEFTFHQDKVNVYRKDPKAGFVFVTVIDIARRQYNDKGDLRKYPWAIQIKNLWAPPIEQPNGTTAYSAGNARDVVEAFIQISDDDMHHCCWAADHFIRVWENANAIPLVVEGLKRRQQNRQNSAQ